MTDDERLAAIRARVELDGRSPIDGSCNCPTDKQARRAEAFRTDVPWLLDRLAEVTAERDEYQDKALCADVDAEMAGDRANKAEAALDRVRKAEQTMRIAGNEADWAVLDLIRAALAVSDDNPTTKE